jgi:folate-binding Fe-S cluster repair protein YgfZ
MSGKGYNLRPLKGAFCSALALLGLLASPMFWGQRTLFAQALSPKIFLSRPLVSNQIQRLASSSMFEYEYVPSNDGGSHDFKTTLPSVYPKETPAGLRGEAVRTALRSTQCLAWKLACQEDDIKSSPNLASGVLQLEGKGVLDFLNNKLSNSFPKGSKGGDSLYNYVQAGLLTSKGHLVDTLSVAHTDGMAFLMPSPGHSGSSLFKKLDPFIFPLDQVKLTDPSENSCIFTLASTQLEHVETAVKDHFLPKLAELVSGSAASSFKLPAKGNAFCLDFDDESSLLVFPQSGVPECACVGFTFVFLRDQRGMGKEIWSHMVGEANSMGPVEIKALEYETLRIEAGQPAFGYEVTGAWKDREMTPATPLELHQKDSIVDTDKGCYMGQEGIASALKNPRGPPRTLYSVVFEDDVNLYRHQSEGDNSSLENKTKMPRPLDQLFVLGSNEEIQVGTITSIAEPYSTGESTIVGLALARRADSILKQMKGKGLQIPRRMEAALPTPNFDMDAEPSSGIIPPPPMDSLDGLEVIVGGTFTVGVLRGVPSRRYPRGKNMFLDQEQVFLTCEEILDQGYVDIEYSSKSASDFLEEKIMEMQNEGTSTVADNKKAEEVAAEEEAAESEAKRKAEKMELLKKRAEEAMTRRRKKRDQPEESATEVAKVDDPLAAETSTSEDDAEAAEAKRKAEKMEMLRKRAEEAIARRKKKKEQQG